MLQIGIIIFLVDLHDEYIVNMHPLEYFFLFFFLLGISMPRKDYL